MKKLYSLLFGILLALLGNNLTAQDLSWKYVQEIGGLESDHPISLMYDKNGDIIHSGSFASNPLYFAKDDSIVPGFIDSYGETANGFLAKYNTGSSKSNVSKAWSKGFTSSSSVYMGGAYVTDANNYFTVGTFFNDTITYDETYDIISRGESNFFIANISSNGNMNWSKVISARTQTSYTELAPKNYMFDDLGNVFITGDFKGDTLDLIGDTLEGNDSDISQIFLAKYDQSGNYQWAFSDSAFNDDYGGTFSKIVRLDNNNEIILAGRIPEPVKTLVGTDTLASSGLDDILMIRIDENGNPLNSRTIGGTDNETIEDIAIDNNNNVYALLSTASDTFSVDGQLLENSAYPDYAQVFLLKFSPAGNLMWHKDLGNTETYNSSVKQIFVSGNNELYIASVFNNSSLTLESKTLYNFDPNPQQLTKSNFVSHDLLMAKYSPTGGLLWAHNLGDTLNDQYSHVMLGGNEEIYYTGSLDTAKFIVENNDTVNVDKKMGFYTGIMNRDGVNTHLRIDTTSRINYSYGFGSHNIWPGQDSTILVSGKYTSDSIGLSNDDTLKYYGNSDIFIGEFVRHSVNVDTSIEGTIYDQYEKGITSGEVELYKVGQVSPYPKIDSVELVSDSTYKFSNLSAGKYLVRYVPDTTVHSLGISTYYGGSVSWGNATVLNTSQNASYTGVDVYLNTGVSSNGDATINGTLTDASGNDPEAVRLASVILTQQPDKDYSQEIMAYAATNSNGFYAFNDVIADSYDIMVDVPGMEQKSAHGLYVYSSRNNYPDYDYEIVEDTIHAIGTTIEGDVYDWFENAVTSGKVELYKYNQPEPFTLVDSVELNGSSHFVFDSLPRAQYVIRAIPDTSAHPGFSATYYGDEVSWMDARIADTDSLGSISYANIYLKEEASHTGNAVISGSVQDTINQLPVKSATVLLMNHSSQSKAEGSLSKFTITDNNGMYKFEGINTGDYSVVVDMPGTDIDSVHSMTVTTNQTNYADRDYIYEDDTIFVKPLPEEIPEGLPYIEGSVYLANEDPVSSGSVELYKVMENQLYSMEKSVILDGDNTYRFESLNTGDYLVRAVPGSDEYPQGIISYYTDAISWQNAEVFSVSEGSENSGSDVYVQIEPERAGEATISGTVSSIGEGKKNSRKQQSIVGKPVKSVSVVLVGKGEEKEKALVNAVAHTRTNEEGEYTFDNVEPGDYAIVVDKPGAYQTSAITVTVTNDQFEYEKNNYVLDGNQIFQEEGFIYGNVVDAEENPMVSGYVKIYRLSSSGKSPQVDSAEINEGVFISGGVPAGSYLVKAFPGKEQYPNYASTYYEQTYSWKEALPVDVAAFDTTSITLMPILVEEQQGNATIEGLVESEDVKVYKSTTEIVGKPVKSVSVVLVGKGEAKEKADGDIIAMTETNESGIYTFDNVEEGSYSIQLDLPGVEQDSSYSVNVSQENNSYENYDYVLQGDTIFVNEKSSPTSIGETQSIVELEVYPNPASEYLYINSEEAEIQNIKVFDVSGKLVKAVQANHQKTIQLNVSQYEKGLYLMKVRTDLGERTMRVYFHE
jgi:protocatechuate 3,4-dioxygenase beta subunit